MPAPTSRRFRTALLLILVVAAGVRTTFILTVARHDTDSFYDAGYYELQARQLGKGHGYNDPFQFLPGHPHRSLPAADHPPLTVFTILPVIATGDSLGFAESSTQLVVRFEMLIFGLFGIVLMAMLARRLAGDTAGLIAGGIAAVYPYLWVNDTLIMSESLAVLCVTGSLLLLLRFIERPKWTTALALGAVCGLGALARAELILLAPLFVIPLLWAWRRSLRAHLAEFGAVVLGVVMIVGPWVAFNQSRFDEPTFISTNDGIAILGSTCDAVFFGHAIGLTNLGVCIPKHAPRGDQSVVSKIYRQRAIDYINDGHRTQFVKVVLARIGRDWGLFQPNDMPFLNEAEGRPRWLTTLGMWFYYPLAALAIGGAVILRRRRVRVWPFLMPPVIVTVGALLSYGQTRFRVPAEPSIVILAAVALAALFSRARARDRHNTIAASSSR